MGSLDESIGSVQNKVMIFVNIDLEPIISMSQNFDGAVKKAMSDAARDLALQTHSHILENVQEKLHSTRQKFVDALSYHQVDQDTWVIELAKEAMFIEEGLPPNTDMLDGLLKSSKAKTAKDGSRFIIVPFEQNKGKTSQTPAQTSLTDTIKQEMKSRKIPYGGLEKDDLGRTKTGLIRSFDIMKNPVKTAQGPGQGHGPIGAVRQGPTGIPYLQGVRVYQTPVKTPEGKTSFKKSIMTFRVASSKMAGKGRWIHPGLEAKRFLDEAAHWALREFEERIKDQILIEVTKSF
jgi:hypothetical protein